MKLKYLAYLALVSPFTLLTFAIPLAIGQERISKPKMKFMGAFDAGQSGASIYKMLDPTEDVVCYILAPDVAGRKAVGGDKWLYDGNAVGSISCLKVRLPVIPMTPAASKK
jgi:hypothetical protein